MTHPEDSQARRLTISNSLSELASHDQPFQTILEHGSLRVEIYKPDQVDRQTPHSRDEVYVIASGTGTFINGNQSHAFEPGEVLFVPAGVEHQFVDFSDDFATWVFFYGPDGGEAAAS